LARAALAAGKPAIAVFALERVLSTHPNDPDALIEKGRAHYLMGENSDAKRCFELAEQQQLTAEQQDNTARYLNAIERRAAAERYKLTGYVEAGGGHDSNINSATYDTTTTLPGPTTVGIADASTRKEDNFMRLRGGINYTGPITAATRFVLGGQADLRRYAVRNTYDTDTYDAYAGLRWLQGRNRYSVLGQAQQFSVDSHLNRELNAAALMWDHTFDARNQLSLFAQLTSVRYQDQKIRDVDQQIGGLTYAHAVDAPGKPLFYFGGYAGNDKERDSAHPEYGQKFWGVRIGGDYSLTQRLGMNGSVIYQDGQHDANDPLFSVKRTDRLLDASLTFFYRFNEQLSLRPQLRYTRNSSNINVYDFERSLFQLTLRYDFN